MFKKTFLLFFAFSFIGISAALANATQVSSTVIGNGIGIGSALAIVICWSRTHAVLTSILAGIFGWFYVIYYCILIKNNE